MDIRRATTVPLREVFTNERTDLSAWLAGNIDFLNDYLPFELDADSVSPEAAAGDFWVDIVADASGDGEGTFKVIIENQLEQTDHDHLGKVLTYVAAFGARAAIWIAARARPEHVKAVQWLNDESPLDAWLFELETICIEGSPVAPILRQIAGPSEVTKRVKSEKAADRAQREANLRFWSIVLPRVAAACRPWGLWAGREPRGNVHSWQTAPWTSLPNIGYQMWVTAEGSWMSLKIDGETAEEVRYLLAQLEKHREQIEAEFGEPLEWRSREGQRSAYIRWDNPVKGGRNSDESDVEAAAVSLAEAAARFAAATKSAVAGLQPYVADDGVSVSNASPSATKSEDGAGSPTPAEGTSPQGVAERTGI